MCWVGVLVITRLSQCVSVLAGLTWFTLCRGWKAWTSAPWLLRSESWRGTGTTASRRPEGTARTRMICERHHCDRGATGGKTLAWMFIQAATGGGEGEAPQRLQQQQQHGGVMAVQKTLHLEGSLHYSVFFYYFQRKQLVKNQIFMNDRCGSSSGGCSGRVRSPFCPHTCRRTQVINTAKGLRPFQNKTQALILDL